jgi:hypothetical protein
MLREGGVATMHRVLHAVSPIYGNTALTSLAYVPCACA